MSPPPQYLPFIVVPTFTSCKTSFIVFGQGRAPYRLYPIATADKNSTSLEELPLQPSAGVLQWNVDFNPGANITWVVSDGVGAVAYSEYRVVQQGAVSVCPKNVYNSSNSNTGPILGGVFGFLLLTLVLAIFLFLRRRRRNQGDLSPLDDDETPGTPDPSRELRVGTFNLDNVAFTPESVHQLKEMQPPPPNYSPKGLWGRLSRLGTTSELNLPSPTGNYRGREGERLGTARREGEGRSAGEVGGVAAAREGRPMVEVSALSTA